MRRPWGGGAVSAGPPPVVAFRGQVSDARDVPEQAPMTPQEADSSSDDGTIHVLLVEDDRRLAELTATYLRKRGLVVDIAADGTTGLSTVMACNAMS